MPEQQPHRKYRGRDLLPLKEVAALLDCSEKTVFALVKERRLLPPVRHTDRGRAKWYYNDVLCYQWRLSRGEFRRRKPKTERSKPSR